MSKVYIALITQNERANIEELTSVAHHFDGLAAVDHNSTDGTYELLDSRKGAGFVLQLPYLGNHSWSMNGFLFHPTIEVGSWLLLRDSNERIAEPFAAQIRPFIALLESRGIETVYQWSKALLFRRRPHQFFAGTPHWGLQQARQPAIQIDQTGLFAKDEDYCYSVRGRNRDRFHFVGAYLRYYLLLDTNHLLLASDKADAVGMTYQIREAQRLAFREMLIRRGYPVTVDGVKQLMKDGLDSEARRHFETDKVLNDAYRYFQLGRTDFVDNHDWRDMVPISLDTSTQPSDTPL